MVFVGLDVLVIVVFLAVFFVGAVVGCGCLCWVGGVFGFGFGFCALVFRVCFDAALFCCLFGCDCDGWDCCFLRFLVVLMWFFVEFVVYVCLLRVVV